MDALIDFHFLRPAWLFLLPAALLLFWLLRRRLRQASAWERVVDPRLAPWVLDRADNRQRSGTLRWLLVGWAVAVLALAGPTWQERPQPVERVTDALVIVLDLSLSMYAEDQPPSRIKRAQLKISDVLGRRREGDTALIAYAGDAHVVVPLTDDHRTLLNLVAVLEPAIMPIQGSRPERALELAHELFAEAGSRRGDILLISDGLRDPGAALTARDRRFPISVLAMGTQEGAPIPMQHEGREGYLTRQGETVISRRMDDGLRQLARQSGGRYAELTADSSDIEALLPELGRRGELQDDRRTRQWHDMGPWLALLLLPVAAMAFRRGLVAGWVLPLVGTALLSLPPAPAQAESGGWWQTADQRGYQALQEGDPERALEYFRDPAWRAATLHRLGRHEEAAATFPGDDADAYYNRGTALARAEDFEAALQALDRALELQPDHQRARHNRQVIDDILNADSPDTSNEQASQRSAPDRIDAGAAAVSRRGDPSPAEGDADPPQAGEEGQGEAPEQGPGEQGALAEQEFPDDAGERGDGMADGISEAEREQAMEQWLRRIPDQPGALLQRKFRYEADQRRRRGEAPTGPGQPW